VVGSQFQARSHPGFPDPEDPRCQRVKDRLDRGARGVGSGGQDGELTLLGGMSAARDGRVDKPDRVRLGDLRQPVCLDRPHAAHLQPDGALRPILEQRLNHIKDDGGGREHGDHNPGAAHHVAWPFGRLATTTLETAKLLSVAVPRDERDAPIEKPMGHGRAHQADAQQPDAKLLLTGLGAHSPLAIISEKGRSGPAIRSLASLAATTLSTNPQTVARRWLSVARRTRALEETLARGRTGRGKRHKPMTAPLRQGFLSGREAAAHEQQPIGECEIALSCGNCSVDSCLQAGGRRFDPGWLHWLENRLQIGIFL
jgi:hypothetical protein